MLFTVIEPFGNRDPAPVYQRFSESGRMLPDCLCYLDRWVKSNFNRCFQLMECDDLNLFQEWILHNTDFVEFEIVPVVPSKVTFRVVLPFLTADRDNSTDE